MYNLIMDKFIWTEDMSVGEIAIDGQHKRLLGAVNDLIDGIVNGINDSKLAETIDFLDNYIYSHLEYEEKYMSEIDFPGLEEHSKIHKDFIEKYNEFKRKIEGDFDSTTLAMEIETYIGNWWLEHIGIEDKKYYIYLLEQNRVKNN